MKFCEKLKFIGLFIFRYVLIQCWLLFGTTRLYYRRMVSQKKEKEPQNPQRPNVYIIQKAYYFPGCSVFVLLILLIPTGDRPNNSVFTIYPI